MAKGVLLNDNNVPANQNEISSLLALSSTENTCTISDNIDAILVEAVENYERGQDLQRPVNFAPVFNNCSNVTINFK